jgi:1-acyl-sn-glycerol-3-phosphate acyltransferase
MSSMVGAVDDRPRSVRGVWEEASDERLVGKLKHAPHVAAVLASLARWVSGVHVHWLWRPVETRPRVYFANHSSHLDTLVLWGALPTAVRSVTRPVAAEAYWQQSALRSFLATRVFRSVLIPRPDAGLFGGRGTLAPMLRELDRGGSLILFPEGTRSNGQEVSEFKGGLYQLCRERSGLEVVPVYLENLSRVLPKGEFLPIPAASSVTFGEPLRLLSGEARSDFLSRARQALRDLRDR